MALQFFIPNLEEVDEQVRELYSEVPGGFQLGVEGVVTDANMEKITAEQKKLERELKERDASNVTLQEKIAAYGDIDPETVEEYKRKLQEAEDEKIRKSGDLEAMVQSRIEKVTKKSEQDLKNLKHQYDVESQRARKFEGLYREDQIKSLLKSEVHKNAMVKQGAMIDVMNRARQFGWQVDLDNNSLSAKGVGDDIIYGENGRDPLTMKEWLKDLQGTADYLFEDSQGGGAQGNSQVQRAPGAKFVDKSSSSDFGKNLEAIAAGKVIAK